MKNTFKKFAGIAAASIMAASMVAPMAMNFTASAASVTIEGLDATVERTFEVYQVFTGTYDSATGTFSALKWGEGVSTYDSAAVTSGELVAANVITALGTDARAIAKKIGTSTTKTTVTSDAASLTINGLTDGYYFIKDVTNLDGQHDANSAFIVQVAADAASPTITIKKDQPKIDKLVIDETTDAEDTADANGWGESADHAINEQFQFKLVATIPNNADLKYYDTYKLVFNDTMSAGVTFDGIASVTVAETATDAYTETATEGAAGQTWSLTLNDIKAIAGDKFGAETFTVEVVYNAHLNENAIVDDNSRAGGTLGDTNCNYVDLQFSNNPDNTGTGATDGKNDLGQTEKDYVWVYTYELNNKKYKIEVKDGNELEGAEFQLLSGGTAVKLIDNGDGTYTVADQNATEGFVTTMVSNASGIFDIKGLDAGDYVLHETDAPDGYNVAPDKNVTIGATHKEQTGTTVDLTLTGIGEGVENSIVDTMNNTLPSTGGVGTTLFYLGGGAMVAVAGVYLISKKRMKNED